MLQHTIHPNAGQERALATIPMLFMNLITWRQVKIIFA